MYQSAVDDDATVGHGLLYPLVRFLSTPMFCPSGALLGIPADEAYGKLLGPRPAFLSLKNDVPNPGEPVECDEVGE